ncbi:nitric oxide reductase activation protein NorD [Oceanisphaera sp. IT1-181]|uniref:nitric oxide reductase activation protein NorD n=1 Tax=Oceanisphaera sp. IT1-181 TaxID=3081199 RepID=UPI0029CA3248|nr:VWA domain-containing protein [Oceanisphaera sp. IT1-181]
MAEPEDLLSDAARHATIYTRRMWRRYRPLPVGPPTALLADVAPRLDLLITAITGHSYPLRIAQHPAHPTFLSRLFGRVQAPWLQQALPATNGSYLWLPADSRISDIDHGNELYRVMALQQALRAVRGSAKPPQALDSALQQDVYLLLEAWATDAELIRQLPGMHDAVMHLRKHALQSRPPLQSFSKARQPLELWLRQLLASSITDSVIPLSKQSAQSCWLANELIHSLRLLPNKPQAENAKVNESLLGGSPLLKDWWTGELRTPNAAKASTKNAEDADGNKQAADTKAPRSSHLPRRPEVREAVADEDGDKGDDGMLMVQLDEPHQQAEDPFGLNRPTDKDEDTSADDFGDMLSDLPEARLVSTPGTPKEVLIADDPPDTNTAMQLKRAIREGRGIKYPEWDFRAQAYRDPGATVRVLPNLLGTQAWVDDIQEQHRSLLNQIRRNFEILSAKRVTRRKQLDGDDIDLNAWIDSYADFRAGGALSDALYQTRRTADRDLAITLLIDVSGSTDSWVSDNKRIIDVEREALLLVCIALQSMGEPYCVQAFSGEGPDTVMVREIKGFKEPFSNEIALRISALEPERYTRAGAAIRHATQSLMQQPASHRLLLLLSDGKPNDKDDYEGQYGVEDMRQAVVEATQQGISAFCLTIDRQAPSYLPRIFGAHHYALLPRPENLPTALLDWLKRLVIH